MYFYSLFAASLILECPLLADSGLTAYDPKLTLELSSASVCRLLGQTYKSTEK